MASSSSPASGSGSGSGNGNGNATTSATTPATTPATTATGSGTERTLDETMRAPTATEPDVVVVTDAREVVVVEEKKKVLILDPEKDLWMSTHDGRHQSPIIPVVVGPNAEIFYVHRAVLTKTEYFSKALNGHFSEAASQSISLPEEDPSIFHFVIAFLYEGTFVPIKPLADALIPEPDKGKGKESDTSDEIVINDDTNNSSSSDSDVSGSDDSARSRRLVELRRRRSQRAWEERNRKEIGRHRPDCTCANCVVEMHGPPCWSCGVPRTRPQGHQRPGQPPYWYQPAGPPPPPPGQQPIHHNPNIVYINDPNFRHGPQRIGGPAPPPPPGPFVPEPRMSSEDLRSWLFTLTLSVSVYLCADRYLLEDLKRIVGGHIIDQFEIAGLQAAQLGVLFECSRLWEALGDHGFRASKPSDTFTDPLPGGDGLVKMVCARTGFLLTKLWRDEPDGTMLWWNANAECAARIMREMGERREIDWGGQLPPMERLRRPPPGPPPPTARRRRELVDD